uniref:Uncharacterized protein n=1 Tax=Setaria viridis TaxID=4556 RepID=A0A4U6ULT8_SETVI|nr:hypothetical protein SEVIR_6G244000v2 [Setaria viridis]
MQNKETYFSYNVQHKIKKQITHTPCNLGHIGDGEGLLFRFYQSQYTGPMEKRDKNMFSVAVLPEKPSYLIRQGKLTIENEAPHVKTESNHSDETSKIPAIATPPSSGGKINFISYYRPC